MNSLFRGLFALGLMGVPALAIGEESARGCVFNSDELAEVCIISHLRLIAQPETYDGRLVAFSTVLAKTPEHTFLLYFSKEAAAQQAQADAIIVESIEGLDVRGDPKTGDWVRVFSRFKDGRKAGTGDPLLGSIDDIRVIYKESRAD